MLTISQAKELVKRHPKRIADFTRKQVEPGFLSKVTKVNYVHYNYNSCLGNTWRYAYSTGDGNLYGPKIVSTDGGKVAIPNLELVVYQNPITDGVFEMSC